MVEKSEVHARVILVDEETGEERSYLYDPTSEPPLTPATGAPRKGVARRFSTPYAVMFIPALAALASDRRMAGREWRLLAAILANAPLNAIAFRVELKALAEMTHSHQTAVSTTLKNLVEIGLILRPKRGWVQLNPSVAWRGPVETRELALAARVAAGFVGQQGLEWRMVEQEEEPA